MSIRRGTVGALMFAVALLTGCAGLPDGSSVRTGQPVQAGDQHPQLLVVPDEPSPGDSPRQIAAGFIKAQMSSQDDYAIARSFLTSRASKGWSPGSTIKVFGGDSSIATTRPDTNTVRVSVPIVATISADGHLTRETTTTTENLEFRVAQDGDDNWRLSSVPDSMGLFISDDDLPRLFQQVSVYYPSSFGKQLVADPRWLPMSGLTTALARAVLSSPPAWLAPAVAEPFPRGTKLDVDAVPITNDGVANVSLSPQVLKADDGERAAMWAAMVATLAQAPNVSTVQLSTSGGRLETDNLKDSAPTVDALGYRMPSSALTSAISRSGTYLAWANPSASDAVAGASRKEANGKPKLPAISADWSHIAAGQGGHTIAAISSDRTSLRRWVDGAPLATSNFGTDLVRPSFDSAGWLWVAGQAFSNEVGTKGVADVSKGSIWVLDNSVKKTGSTPMPVPVSWLGSSTIRSLAISPEGQRVMLVLGDDKATRTVVASIMRDSGGEPIGLGRPHEIAEGVSNAKDAVWTSPTEVAVLGNCEGAFQPCMLTLDDGPAGLGRVPAATALTSTVNDAAGLFVSTSNGTVYSRIGSAWNAYLSRGEVIIPTP